LREPPHLTPDRRQISQSLSRETAPFPIQARPCPAAGARCIAQQLRAIDKMTGPQIWSALAWKSDSWCCISSRSKALNVSSWLPMFTCGHQIRTQQARALCFFGLRRYSYWPGDGAWTRIAGQSRRAGLCAPESDGGRQCYRPAVVQALNHFVGESGEYWHSPMSIAEIQFAHWPQVAQL